MTEFEDGDEKLTMEILMDPEHEVTKAILLVYSLESFLHEEIKKGGSKDDTSKCTNLGPYIFALTQILKFTSEKRDSHKKFMKGVILYRGAGLTKKQIEHYKLAYKMGQII